MTHEEEVITTSREFKEIIEGCKDEVIITLRKVIIVTRDGEVIN